MRRLRLALELLFQRQMHEDEDASLAFERMAREIQGSIFFLITVFVLVALASYLPLDTLNLAEGRLDRVNNLGGIVGAVLAQWLLGSVGAMGYLGVLVSGWLTLCSFRGISLKNNLLKIIGAVLTALLGAMGLYLAFHTSAPEVSLLQGGAVGRNAGSFLVRYFNTTGALLMLSGGFLLTFILTTGVSLSSSVSRMLEPDTESDEDEEDLWEEESEDEPDFDTEDEPDEETADSGEEEEEAAPRPPRTRRAARSTSRRKRAKAAEDDEEKTEELDLAALSGGKDGEEESGGFQQVVPFKGDFSLPSLRLLKNHSNGAKKLSRSELKENSRKLCEHLLSFQITGEVVNVSQGPALTIYEFKPSAGIKLSKIANLQDDLGLVLGTRELRIQAPIPGKTVVGIEVPRPEPEVISFKEIVGADAFYDKKLKLPIALGKSTAGEPVFGDLAAMPHLLVAGATGSGKSVFINTMIMSFLYRLTPNQLRMILVDPKMLELNCFEGLPHLLTNVITRSSEAHRSLEWAVEEMERRYDEMAKTGSKNIESYNSKQKTPTKKLPYIVIVVDELADLMMSGDKDAVEVAITRLAQKARAAGIHLVIATQRPSTDVITGLIKANIPSRLAFKVPSAVDSRTVLDTTGAQNLIGRGDSMMIRPGIPLQRIHGCYVSEEELERVVKNVKGGKKHDKIYIKFK